MVTIETYDSTAVESQGTGGGDREKLKLEAGQRVSGMTLIDATCGESDYGTYVLIGMIDNEEVEYSMLVGDSNVFGRNCIETFTSGDDGFRMIKDAFVGRSIWIGKSTEIISKKGAGKPYFALEWNFMD